MTDKTDSEEREALIRAITSMCHDMDNDKIVITRREGEGPALRQLLDAMQRGLANLPSSGFDAADMATAWSNGFKDGVASLAASAGSEPVAGMNEYGVRGYLAATLKCWHRLTGDEAAELVAMTQRLSGLYQPTSLQEGMAGWKLVPIEPTEEMLAAAHDGDREYTLRNFGDVMTVMQGPYDHWAAMIDAAPPTTSAGSRKGE